MNNLFNQLMPNGQGNSQFSWLMNMVRGNPQGLANMVQSNPKFNEFVANYNENLTQTDKQELMSGVDKQTSVLLSELHAHLDSQDKKIDKILTMLGEKTQ